MSWVEYHSQSEEHAAKAEEALKEGRIPEATELYAKAAEWEAKAAEQLDDTKKRTLGISCVSSVALWFKAHEFKKAELEAHKWLCSPVLPDFARDQLKHLLQAVWSEGVRQKAGVNFARGEVIVSVRGGEVVAGGAPLDLIVEKIQTVRSFYFRTIEHLRGLPYRRRGNPSPELVEACVPWLFQTLPGSYQFAVAVQEPAQGTLFPEASWPKPWDISTSFLEILRASSENPEDELPRIVPDDEYRNTFLRLTRNLAPTGKKFSEMEVGTADKSRSVVLRPDSRAAISSCLRSKPTQPPEEIEEVLRGVLRAVHLDKDWIEVTVQEEPIHITRVGEAVDDVIGPMVNHPVVVYVTKDVRGKYLFRDIESDE